MFAKILTVAACAFVAVAQAVNLQFTSAPNNVVVGEPTTISWTGGDGSPVTITLRKGDPNNLSTVSIITGSATGNSFTWTPSDIESGEDYALQISQGVDTTNYSGQFTVSGGSSASTTVVAVAGSTTVPLTTLSPSATANATSTASVSVTAILTGASSSGTGSSVPRNTTFLSQTLSSTSTGRTSATLTASTTGGSSASSTASASGSASSGNAGASLTASMGMGLGALAAAMFVL